MNITLASKSPRRLEILTNNGYCVNVVPSKVNEVLPFDMKPTETALYFSLIKALDVSNNCISEDIIVASDTIVVFNNKIIGKPKDINDARKTLWEMRNKKHTVITGVCIISKEKNIKKLFSCETEVYFKDFTIEELEEYINTDEPYDKAGGYGIQGTFSKYIEKYVGDYNNVVGFPADAFNNHLKTIIK